MARLVWKRSGGGEGKTYPLGERCVLGRDSTADCVLDTKSVSRRHATIEQRGGRFFIADLGSTNGTLVNGVRITEPTQLDAGDKIQVGDEALEFLGELDAFPAGQLTKGSLETAPLERRAPPRSLNVRTVAEEILPRRVGKFYLLRRLGHGGMGTVYHALDLDSNREVAVKFIRSNIGRNEAFLDFFHNREAVLAREINHPNVIRIYEHGVESEQHYISMEYVVGRNLYHVMKERRPTPAEVLEIIRQLACGLVAAHRQGVVHSDVKPANILLIGEFAREATERGQDDGREEGADSAHSILEFDTEMTAAAQSSPAAGRYDKDLLDEIRKRVGEPSLDAIVDPPYFARQSEMNFLLHYLDRVMEGGSYLLLVEGEVGNGKNRLLSEFARLAATRAESASGDAPAERPRMFELDCARIEGVPLLAEQLLGMKPAGSFQLRLVAEEASRQLLVDDGPKILRLLNLGNAIPVVCDFLASLGSAFGSAHLLVVGTLVPGEIRNNGSLKTLLDRMAPFTKELYLRPLTEYQIQRYLQLIFRDALTGMTLAGDLYRLSGGNFSKLLEILRGFFERGVLSMDRPSGRLIYRPRQLELELEEGKSMYEKYRSQGKIEQQVLEQAAFIGPRFLFDTLLKLHDINETSLFFIVRTLLGEGFFIEEGRTWYGFTNVAFQRYMAERIPESERPHLHRRISRLLQMVPVQESAELLQLRARHLSGCNEQSKAVQCLLEGAHLARCEYRVDLAREMMQEILRIYRMLARRENVRREVTGILRDWFRKDGNWYEILGELGSEAPTAKVKIADFGISFRLKDEERGYQIEKRPVLGTPRYMAPERGQGDYGGFKSDVFSLGIIAYEMAVGTPPFPELKGNDVIQANREIKIALPPEVSRRFPAGMDALITGMLEKDARKRWEAERVVREVAKLQFDLKTSAAK